jgi:hypothetical protein
MKYLVVLILIGLASLQFVTSVAFACECFGNSDYTKIFDNSEIVFVGTVNNIVVNETNYLFTTFDVNSITKGEFTENQITTSEFNTDCSVNYEIGATYVVAIHDKEFLSTDRCSTKPLEIMRYYEVIPDVLLSAMREPEIPHGLKCIDSESDQDRWCDDEKIVQIPPPENDAYQYVSNGLSKLQKAIREDIPIGNYRFNDVVHGGGIDNNNLHITINPGITDPAEQEEIFQELVIILGFDSFEINFAKPTQQTKALCESPEVILVDGVCQKITTEDPIEFFTAEQPPEWLWFGIGGLFMLCMILLIWRKRK